MYENIFIFLLLDKDVPRDPSCVRGARRKWRDALTAGAVFGG